MSCIFLFLETKTHFEGQLTMNSVKCIVVVFRQYVDVCKVSSFKTKISSDVLSRQLFHLSL